MGGFGIQVELEEGKTGTVTPLVDQKGNVVWTIPVTEKNIKQIENSYYKRPGFFVEMKLKMPENPFKKKEQDDRNKKFLAEREIAQKKVDKLEPEIKRLQDQVTKQSELKASKESDFQVEVIKSATKKAEAPKVPKELLALRTKVTDLVKKTEDALADLEKARSEVASAGK
jgi:hydroxymethylpyrimidine pyrophosphatase-like HAD family hydrolase